MRDRRDNVVVVCSIENLDPMGVHTGDSITVAPAMTLTDREYQHMRDVGIAVLRAVGVDTGGCNIQFAVNPETGRLVVIEMNPRVSRSSRAGVQGHRLPDREDRRASWPSATPSTRSATTSPARRPRLRADAGLRRGQGAAVRLREVPGRGPELTTTMKSVGEAMALGRSFAEALGKALRSMETTAAAGSGSRRTRRTGPPTPRSPTEGRIYAVERALRAGATRREVARRTGIDPWFLDQIAALVELRRARSRRAGARRAAAAPGQAGGPLRPPARRAAPRVRRRGRRAHAAAPAGRPAGLQDRRHLRRRVRRAHAVPLQRLRDRPRGRVGDRPADRAAEGADPRLRAEPDRAGHRVRLLVRARGDGAARGRVRDRDGQLQPGDRLHRLRHRRPPLLRAADLRGRARGRARRAGVRHRRRRDRAARRPDPAGARRPAHRRRACRWSGPSAAAIDLAEDRGAFGEVLRKAGLPAPAFGMATSFDQAQAIAARIGYPVLVRPSYVLGGRGMEIVYDDETLAGYIARATDDQPGAPGARRPVPRRRRRDRRRRALRRHARCSSAA